MMSLTMGPSSNKSNKNRIFLLIGVAILGLAVAWEYFRGSRIENGFSAVHVGALEREVEGLLGRPSWIEPCGKSLGSPAPNCSEYIYRDSFAPLLPAYYSVRFDNRGHVIGTYRYSSP